MSADPQSINMELETTFELDRAKDTPIISNLRRFFNKLSNILGKSSENKMRVTEIEENPKILPDFLKYLIEGVKSLSDDEIKKMLKVAESELRIYKNDAMRRFVAESLELWRGNPKKVRKYLDHLLRQINNSNNIKKDIFFLKMANLLYKKESKRTLMNLFNKLKLFRRNSERSSEDLTMIVQEIIHDIFDRYNNLNLNKKQVLRSLIQDHVSDENEVNFNNVNKKSSSESIESEEKRSETYEDDSEELISTIKMITKSKKYSRRLTHITLYPTNAVKENKRMFESNYFNKERSKVTTYKPNIKKKEKAKENSETEEDLIELSEEEVVVKNNVSHSNRSITAEDLTRDNDKHKTTVNIFEISSKGASAMETPSSSFEEFGSLHKTYTINPKKVTDVHVFNDNFTLLNIKEYESTTTLEKFGKIVRLHTNTNHSIYLNRRTYNPPFENNKDRNVPSESFNPKLEKSEKKEQKITIYKDNKPTNGITTKLNNEAFTTKSLKNYTIEQNLTDFNLNKYIKQSEILQVEDENKKKEIEKKIQEDLGIIFTTNATEVYKDVFKDLEDAFNLS